MKVNSISNSQLNLEFGSQSLDSDSINKSIPVSE